MSTDTPHQPQEENQDDAAYLAGLAKRYDDLGLNVLAQAYRNRADEEREPGAAG